MKVLITTVPFGQANSFPLEMLNSSNVDYVINPLNRKLTEDELVEMISDFEVVIAGTEPITRKVIDSAKNLKLISRVGIGLDNVDLLAAREKGISVCYTPDAPAPAVAELTIGLMLSLLRMVHVSNSQLHNGLWERKFGRRMANVTIGIIGAGRIGGRVARKITRAFGTPRFLVNDINPDNDLSREIKLEWSSKEKIYREADIISLHLPLTSETRNMITRQDLLCMKSDAMIINTARGGIINEKDLFDVLKSGHLAGAAIDVFEQEPYLGPLAEIERCILTAHLGSMSVDCRGQMEIEATQKVIKYINGDLPMGDVPESEFQVQKRMVQK